MLWEIQDVQLLQIKTVKGEKNQPYANITVIADVEYSGIFKAMTVMCSADVWLLSHNSAGFLLVSALTNVSKER